RRLVSVRGRAVRQGRRGRQAPRPSGPGCRRPEVPHRLPSRLRHAPRRLARLRQQGRAGATVGRYEGTGTESLRRMDRGRSTAKSASSQALTTTERLTRRAIQTAFGFSRGTLVQHVPKPRDPKRVNEESRKTGKKASISDSCIPSFLI